MGSLLTYALYLIHNGLLQSGVDSHSALIIISSVVFVLMLTLIILTFVSLHNLKNLLKFNNRKSSDVGKIIEAFKEGWEEAN